MTTTRTKHAGGTTVEVFDLTPFGFMGFNTNPLRQVFGDPWHLYGYGLESAPVASSVAFTGTETVGQVLTGSYTYSDADGDLEGTTTFQWYRSNDGAGAGKAAIAGATSSTYTLVAADEAKYITFGVTPIALTGTTTGAEVQSAYSGAVADGNFVTTWSATSGEKLTVPHTGTGYSFDIDWGDGETQTGLTEADAPFVKPTNYATTEAVTITITGTFPRVYFNNGGDKTKLTAVTNWGSVGTTSAERAFYGCTNLASIAAGAWSATNWDNGFRGTAISALPDGCFADNSACTTAIAVFYDTDISTTPTNLFGTFTSCVKFNQAFHSCTSLSTVSATTFANCGAVDSMDSTFDTCTSLTTVPSTLFSDCPLIKGTIFGGGFYHTFEASGLSTIPAGLFDAQTIVQSFPATFYGCSSLLEVPSDLFKLNVASISFVQCFSNCSSLTTVNSGALEFNSAATSYDRTFDGCGSLVDFESKVNCAVATTLAGFLDNSTINTTDYNALMTDLEAQRVGAGIQSGVIFDGGSSVATGQGATDRASVASNESWTFQDSTP